MQMSPAAIKGMGALQKASATGVTTPDDFVATHDLILAVVNMENGSRQAPIHMTVQMYAAFHQDPQTRKKVVIIPKKKQACQGPAKLVVSLQVQELLAIYLSEMRFKFAN